MKNFFVIVFPVLVTVIVIMSLSCNNKNKWIRTIPAGQIVSIEFQHTGGRTYWNSSDTTKIVSSNGSIYYINGRHLLLKGAKLELQLWQIWGRKHSPNVWFLGIENERLLYETWGGPK